VEKEREVEKEVSEVAILNRSLYFLEALRKLNLRSAFSPINTLTGKQTRSLLFKEREGL